MIRLTNGKAFKHIFTSPSSVDDSGRSTKSSNAALHGMVKVTPASIAYVATLVSLPMSFSVTHTNVYIRCALL